jgi:uncharacterized membrane protein YfcA
MSVLLPLVFFGIAFLYAMAGFGGGSSYIAFLAISGLPVASIPVLALSCNLIVSGQGSLILARTGNFRKDLLLPLLAGSVPAAFLGGAWRIDAHGYLWILAIVLTLSGLALLLPSPGDPDHTIPRSKPLLFALGAALGGLAGLSGIGGGIFLAPVLHLIRAASAREVASAASLFIALNSAAGLLGQLTKDMERLASIPVYLYVLCPLAVLAGGFIGSRTLSLRLQPVSIRRITACVVLLVAFRIWLKLVLDV